MFRIGQKVVCIRDDEMPSGYVRKGNVYTICDIRSNQPFRLLKGGTGVGTGVKVDEVWLDTFDWFNANRFRPIVERKTDISIFTKMLTPNRQNVTAE